MSMSAVATTSGNNICKRQRSSSDEDSDSGIIKRPRYYYILEPETTDYSSDGSESIYSIQLRTTDTAKDTSDTSTKSEDSVEEFEVVSNCGDSVYPFPLIGSSSTPEDIASDGITFEIDPKSLVNSDWDACDTSSIISEKGKDYIYKRLFLFKMCAHCGQKNDIPLFRCCKKCYKVRKNFFPPRPRRRKRKTEKKASVSKDDNKSSSDSGLNSALSLTEKALEVKGMTENSSDHDSVNIKELCGTCLMEPKNGGYVHNNIVHCYSCYRCSVKTIKQIGRCPICNLQVRQVCRVITI